ncbi:hypothetical protein BD410DRAFT_732222 [Rickenella mellea]|uniref:SH3 domain-containing protein n=1 Tax=Rickenella mellea TaxID=50990 RepID=A0A4Y7PL31_9AGAM|nr:hypothetical protein BD410DRAFT_732222 [Rickenella mellea]
MSVAPFTPTESWSFPRPPSTHTSDSVSASSGESLTSDESLFFRTPQTTPRMVCRPFEPSMGDELPVKRGDEVHILNLFSDGWARIRKVDGRAGLIPVDCLRDGSEDTQAFLASLRMGS